MLNRLLYCYKKRKNYFWLRWSRELKGKKSTMIDFSQVRHEASLPGLTAICVSSSAGKGSKIPILFGKYSKSVRSRERSHSGMDFLIHTHTHVYQLVRDTWHCPG